MIVIHAMNIDVVVIPRGMSSQLFILVNKPLKDHLKQLNSNQLMLGELALTPFETIETPSLELLCQ